MTHDALVDVRRQVEDVDAGVSEAVSEECGRGGRLRLRFDQLPETAVVELLVSVVQVVARNTEGEVEWNLRGDVIV